MRQIFADYLSNLSEVSGVRAVWALALMTLFSLTEGVGILLLLPMLEVAGFNLQHQGAAGRFAKAVEGGLAAVGIHPTMLILLLIFIFLITARTLLGARQSVVIYALIQDLELHLRRRLYHAISSADWLFICRSRSTDFVHALTAEIERTGNMTYELMMMAQDLILALLYVAIAFELSPPMTGLVLLCGGILVLALRGKTRKLLEPGTEVSDQTGLLYAAATEHLQGIKIAKSYNAVDRDFAIFSELSGRVGRANVDAARQHASLSAWFEIGSAVLLGVVLYVAVEIIAVPPAAILILLALFSRVMPRLMAAYRSWGNLITLLPAFANVQRLIEKCGQAAEHVSTGDSALEMRRQVRLEAVCFAYDAGSSPAVNSADIEVARGCVTALVGASGAGKSTIADLMMGLLVPDSGKITVDGVMLDSERLGAWREHIGYVAQDTVLFHDTIRSNLLWANPAATEKEIADALKMASADELVGTLAHGLETVVGDRGILFSQGERQRLAIARALLRHPSLLILDEATNSLDSENEARVLAGLQALREQAAILLIAHRLSTIRWADRIYVIENGGVVESGDWNSLSLKVDGRFRALCESQYVTA